MKIKFTASRYVLPLLLLTGMTGTAAVADSKTSNALAVAQRADRTERDFRSAFKNLSKKDQDKVIASLSKHIKSSSLSLGDPDGDSVPNILENAVQSNQCSSDSDHDGSDDKDELDRHNNPNDNDSNHDGVEDGQERESKGTVSNRSGDTFTIGTQIYVLQSTTTYKKLTLGDVVDGACVEVKGNVTQDSSIAVIRVQAENHCN